MTQVASTGYAALSTNAIQHVVEGATHGSLLTTRAGAAIVAEAVREVIESARHLASQSRRSNHSRRMSEQRMEHEGAVVYQIRIKGHVDQTWSDWFAPLAIINEPGGEATLTGTVRDQSELHGLIDKIFNLNLTLLAVNRITSLPE